MVLFPVLCCRVYQDKNRCDLINFFIAKIKPEIRN